MTTNDLEQAERARADAAVLAVRRAAVRRFMALDPDTQRRLVAEATDDAQTIGLAMRMIATDAQELGGCGCRCRA